MTNILIAGCGYVGTELGRLLVAGGRQVIGLRRTALKDNAIPGMRWFEADLTRPETLRGLPEITACVYTASAAGRTPEAYRAAYVDGVNNMIAALEDHPLRRFLFTSSTSVYTQRDGELVDEGAATEPTHFGGRTILEGEAAAAAAPCASSVIRFGGIYGPGRRRLIDMVKRGEATVGDGAPLYTNRIHLRDCAGALAHLLDLEPLEGVYNGVDTVNAPRREVLEFIADALGVPRPTVGPREGLSERTLRSNKRVSSARLQASGYGFVVPTFREGYREMIEGEERGGAEPQGEPSE